MRYNLPVWMVVLLSGHAADGQVYFKLTGNFGGNQPSSMATGVSADGTVVAGYSATVDKPGQAFRWTESDGLVALPGVKGGSVRVSGDGTAFTGGDNNTDVVWRWTAAGGEDLGPWEPHWIWPTGINRDGSVIVGTGSQQYATLVWMWTPAGGIQEIGVGMGWKRYAEAVASDALVIVGKSSSSTHSFEAFRWTPEYDAVALGSLPGDFGSAAFDASADGEVVVGHTLTEYGGPIQPFRWTEAGGMVGLGTSPGQIAACSADASVLTGTGVVAEPGEPGAMVWDAAHGARGLKQILLDHGVGTGNLKWLYPVDISDDGRVIVGYGYAYMGGPSQGWVVRIPAVCRADCDTDGALTIDDFICFQARFASEHIYGDCDIDGLYTIDDFVCFQTYFALGCP